MSERSTCPDGKVYIGQCVSILSNGSKIRKQEQGGSVICQMHDVRTEEIVYV